VPRFLYRCLSPGGRCHAARVILTLFVLLVASSGIGRAAAPDDAPPRAELSPLRPRAVADGWLFSYVAPMGTRTVHLAGEFNGWSGSAWPMTDADGDLVWTLTTPLETGRTYQYKYVINGTEWVTDPHAEATDPNNFNNGILVTRRPGEPWFRSFVPADGARLTSLSTMAVVIMPEGHAIRTAKIRLADWLGRRSWTLAAAIDPATHSVSAPLPPDLEDGDWLITVEIELEGAAPLSRTIGVTLDRWTGRVDAPPFWDRAVLYEAFVRSFQDGPDDDSIGDITGLTRRLDYLNDGDPATTEDLGIDGIWLMPVHPSPSYHGYDVTDYEGIESDYGSLDDYRTFVAEAHRRGIRVVLDYVANHSSNQHPWFLAARGNPTSPYSSWYKFQDAGNETYAGFANIDEMPELNFRSAEMRARLLQMARFWLDLDNDGDLTDGVDGFRFDVAKGPPHDFWRELRHEVKGLRSDFLLLGEVWDNAETIGSYFHDQYDMNFDYPLYYATLELLGGKKTPAQYLSEYAAVRQIYPPGAQLVRFLDNHDNNRIASVLGANPERQRLATGLLFTLPGTPLIYYGMEIGMEGMKPDPDIRRPMRWDLVEAQNGDPSSLLSWHRDLIRLRRELPALSAPDEPAAPSLHAGRADDARLLVFERRDPSGGLSAMIVANPGGETVRTRIELEGDPGASGKGLLRPRLVSRAALAGTDLLDQARGTEVELGPWGFGVWELVPR